jgi:hypothetical protein
MHRLPLYLFLWIVFVFVVMRSLKNSETTTRIFNFGSMILVLLPLVSATVGTWVPRAWKHDAAAITMPSALNQSMAVRSAPDIYYIILDGYARADTLEEVFGFDNTPFLNEMMKRGFVVASRSTSNYANTGSSIPSTLKMEYLAKNDPRSENDPRLENNVRAFLMLMGYRYIKIASLPDSSIRERSIVDSARDVLFGEFSLVLLRMTVLDPLAGRFNLYSYSIRKNVLGDFDKLAATPRLDGKKFVFAHIVSPHPPYVFGPNGESVGPTVSRFSFNVYLTPWDDSTGYVNQVRFVNKKVIETVDVILKESRIPPIIIVQGDHGPNLALERSAKERAGMRILNMYLLPGRASAGIYQTITPVNTFRLLFNEYFGAKYPLLPDRCYFSLFERPTDFSDVTGLVR